MSGLLEVRGLTVGDECVVAVPALRIVASDHAARCILVWSRPPLPE